VNPEFLDYEPEDAWDATDAIANQVDNLLKRLDVLQSAEPSGRWRPFIVDIEQRLRPWIERRDTGQLNARDELRVTQLVEDLNFVRERDDRGE
jgi:hypothetical protein